MIENQSCGHFSRAGGKGLVRHYPYFLGDHVERGKGWRMENRRWMTRTKWTRWISDLKAASHFACTPEQHKNRHSLCELEPQSKTQARIGKFHFPAKINRFEVFLLCLPIKNFRIFIQIPRLWCL
jgi:hypothetical protein